MRFVIDAPPYRNSSAGVRVLHRLCHLLNESGEDAALTTAALHPQWTTSSSAYVDRRTVVIYPESTAGNPLGAERVVRYYVLSRTGGSAAAGAAAPGELVVYLDDWLRDAAARAAGSTLGPAHRLFISVLEPDLFYPARGLRLVDCVHVGKAGQLARRFPAHTAPLRYRITDQTPATRNGLATLLRRTRRLYAYDSGSALPFEAALCGAQVLAVRADGTLEPSVPWETHDVVRAWWDAGLPNVRSFVALVRAHWRSASRS